MEPMKKPGLRFFRRWVPSAALLFGLTCIPVAYGITSMPTVSASSNTLSADGVTNSSVLLPQTADSLVIDLKTALEIALSENPTVKVADMEIEKKQYAKKGHGT